MADINITNFGGFYTTGNSIHSIALGDDGSVYIAGGKNVGTPGNGPNRDMDLAIFCYKDGVLQWERVFGGPYKYEAFMSLSYKDGYVYASGGIGYAFRTDNEGLPGESWPSEKPYYPERTGLEPDSAVGQPTLATVFVKLDAASGETVIGKVVDSSTSGNLGFSSIDADNEGKIYVTSANTLFRYDENGSSIDNGIHAGSAVRVINGAVWAQAGSRITKIDSNGDTIQDYYPKIDNEDELGIVDFVVDSNGDVIVALQKQDLSKGNLPDDLWALGLNPVKSKIPKGLVTTQIRKISGETGEFLWTTTINEECISCPSSISLTPDGKIVVTGWTIGDLNGGDDIGEKSFGTFDAFFVTLENGETEGTVIQTQIIGTARKGESINKGIFDSDGNLFLAGEFDSKYFSLNGSGFQNVYLISDTSFTLMGDELDNVIHSGDGSDSIDGGRGSDTLYGGDGNDSVSGGDGNDLIIGGDGAGNDKYTGGLGVDTVRYSSAVAGITVNLSAKKDHAKSIAQDAGIGVDQLSGIENVIGGNYSDRLSGSKDANILFGASGDDVIDGGGGIDVMWGGAGSDVYYVDNSNDQTFEAVSETDSLDAGGVDLVYSSVTRSLGSFLEDLTLTGRGAINGTGNELDNVVRGNQATNMLFGGAGTDTIYGEAGNDWLSGFTDYDESDLNDSDFADLVSSQSSVVDRLHGGKGDDVYLIHGFVGTPIIYESISEGIDTVLGDLALYILPDNVENYVNDLSLTENGAPVAVEVTGNNLNNTLKSSPTGWGNIKLILSTIDNAKESKEEFYGLGGNDTILAGGGDDLLSGGTGNDRLVGGAGNDQLDGGAGADAMSGGTGDDVYVVDNIKDAVTEKANEGNDTIETTLTNLSIAKLSAIENLTYTGLSNATLVGNTLANTLTGSTGSDTLHGGSGADMMIGGFGDDTYIVDNATDSTQENLNMGSDSVQASISYTLSDNVEHLTLTGKAAINGTGNSLDNRIIGNSAGNTLIGGQGNDTIDGGAGNDTLLGGDGLDILLSGLGNDTFTGGDGGDTFRFSSALSKTNIDTITDFLTNVDRLELDDAVFKKFIGDSNLSDNFVSGGAGVKALDTNDYLIFNTASGALFYDADGSGKGAAVQFATLVGVTDLSASDFWIV